MRSPEAKAQRRQDILAAARGMFAATPYDAIRVQDIVTASGLAKGTFYLYFETKEAVFLALMLDELALWFEQIQARLGSQSWQRDEVAGLLSATLAGRDLLRRLLGLLHNVLEAALSSEQTVAFKQRLLLLMAPMAQALEAALALPAGDGTRLLLNLHALVIGLEQMSRPAPGVAEALVREGLDFLQPDFGPELDTLLRRLLAGWDHATA